MFTRTPKELQSLNAWLTVREITQQPNLWLKVYSNYTAQKHKLEDFLQTLPKPVTVIFAGAGSSAYIGDIITPYLMNNGRAEFNFKSIPTTDIVSNPYLYLNPKEPTLLVSLSRNGNSPESLAAVNLVRKIVEELFLLNITCNPEGILATSSGGFNCFMPPDADDKAFAMTSSFTCMLLCALLIFSKNTISFKEVRNLAWAGQMLIDHADEYYQPVNLKCTRIVFLGSGVFNLLGKEACLKVLELTAGEIAVLHDSPLAFRHGSKSFIDEDTLVVAFLSSNRYTRMYDIDTVREIINDKIAKEVVVLSSEKADFHDTAFEITVETTAEDIYLTLPYIVFCQILAALKSVKMGIGPDNPSPDGMVQRVNIYEYNC